MKKIVGEEIAQKDKFFEKYTILLGLVGTVVCIFAILQGYSPFYVYFGIVVCFILFLLSLYTLLSPKPVITKIQKGIFVNKLFKTTFISNESFKYCSSKLQNSRYAGNRTSFILFRHNENNGVGRLYLTYEDDGIIKQITVGKVLNCEIVETYLNDNYKK